MHEQAAALDMAQKIVAQADPLARPLDHAGDIRHDERGLGSRPHHPQHGSQGGKGIVGDLGLGFADDRDEGGLAHVREAYQPHVGQQFEFQAEFQRLTRHARFGKPGHLPRRGGEMGVAPATPPAFGRDEGLVRRNVGDQPSGLVVVKQGAAGHLNHAVRPGPAEAAVRPAVLPRFRGVFPLIPEIRQGIQAVVGHEYHVAAPAAVAPVRPACRDIFLPAEAHRPVATAAGLDRDHRFIDKHVAHVPSTASRPAGRGFIRSSIHGFC